MQEDIMNRKVLGALGEEKAKHYFQKKGYTVVSQNYQLHHGEIDLIVRAKKQLIFVEVKTRVSGQFGLPEESITYKKAKSLMRSVKYYLSRGNFEGFSWQIDLVAINLDEQGKAERFEHFENIIGA
ncbi:YraN family protein [candidate division WWE3 bacterium CG06_land_8_20_14_3_00_42_16]|uniref:UPF0102 protein COS81_04430 n=4 Tax=Katanobacteria TaxID=422282 RepID=A0A2M7ALN6_UNCKA|nr:MAG: YraN family protein [candidate division WWE3 bacterium CG06_land_8_20_14_3_00_42_16]PIZ41785.1 MAG: YraN family protein [candidate division WWE3 bacterium CG_4_10_14_0_2_um_filter_42_8]